MKYLDIPSLALLSQSLTFESPECKVYARLEAYSCKNVRNERRLWKGLEEGWKEEIEGVEELSISPELKSQSLHSPFGPLDHKDSRHTHFLLVSTLNLAFPDYDFTRVKPERFEREIGGARGVLSALSGVVWGGAKDNGDGSSPRSYGSYPSALHSLTSPPTAPRSLPSGSSGGSPASSSFIGTHPMLHKILNDVINLDDCVVYSYVPEPESDPHGDPADDDNDDDDDNDGDEMMDPDGDVSDDDGMMMMMDDDDQYSMHTDDGVESSGFASAGLQGGGASSTSTGRYHPSSSPIKRNGSGNTSSSDGPRTPRAYEVIGRPASGLLWSVYYFFYNKRQKRILFLSVWARSRGFSSSPYLRPASFASRINSHPIHVVHPSSAGSHPRSTGFHPSPSSLSTMALPPSKSPQIEGMPSIDGIAKNIILAQSRDEVSIIEPGSTKAHPIRIDSATPTPATTATTAIPGMTTAAATLAAASVAGSISGTPPPTSPAKATEMPAAPRSARQGRSMAKLRRERSESVSTTASARTSTSGGGEKLRELADGMAAGRAGKRIKVG